MRALKAYGYTAVTMQDVLDYRAGIKTAPAKPIVLTFDDAYESLLTVVLPILADPTIDFKATAFIDMAGVRPENVDGGWPTDPLSWSEIRELNDSGRVDIESHTIHHWDLTTLDPATMLAELAGSKAILEQELGGKQVNFLAYPYGTCNAAVDMATWQAGYTAGLQVNDEVEATCANKFELQRVQMDENTSVDLGQSGWYEFFMSKIGDSDVAIPNLSVTGIQYLDPLTNNPIDLTQVQPGQTVLIKVNVNNAAAPAGDIATLSLDSNTDHNNGVIYNSHTTTPSQDIQVKCPWAVFLPVDVDGPKQRAGGPVLLECHFQRSRVCPGLQEFGLARVVCGRAFRAAEPIAGGGFGVRQHGLSRRIRTIPCQPLWEA